MGVIYTQERTTSTTVTNYTHTSKFYFRMAFNKSLNATCNLDGYLFCKMPAGVLEVEIKVKTTWGKFSMLQDSHTRTKKYHAWEKADGRSHVGTRKRKAPCKMTNMQTKDNTSKTNVPVGQGFRYSPQVFTDPNYAVAMPHTEEEGEMEQESKFLGKYCELCDRCGKIHCWCNSSDWEERLLDVEKPGSNPSIEKTPSPTFRKPPVGWTTHRHRVVRAAEEARPHHSKKNTILIVMLASNE